MALNPKELLLRPLRWRKVRDGRWRAVADGQECVLQMNDFPEEPLYTLTVGELSLDLDDPPLHWTIE
jgi:hypothetical protein